ncbi:MAG: ATP-binding protein [Propionibacteriaceae bacterium]
MSSRRGGVLPHRLPSSRGVVLFALAAVVSLLLVAALAYLLRPASASSFSRVVLSTVITDLLALAVAVASAYAAYRAQGRDRWAWSLMTLAGTLWLAGELSWVYENLLSPVAPDLPPSDVIFLLAYLPAAGALLCFPNIENVRRERTRSLLGALLIGTAVLFVSRSLALRFIFPAASGSTVAQALYVASPIADIILTSLALTVLIRAAHGPQLHVVLVGFGFLVYAIGDTVYARAAALGTYVAGSLLDVVWVAGYALFALAALASVTARHQPVRPRPAIANRYVGMTSLLVYVPLLVAVVVATARPAPIADPVLIVAGLAMLVIFGLRQAMLAIDNGRLRHDLQGRVWQLEERTSELRRLALQNENILQSVVDGVLGVDSTGRVTFVNARAGAMLGRRPEDVIGTPERDLFAVLPAEAVSEVGMALRTGTVVRSARSRFARADRSEFPVELAVGPIREGGVISGAVVVFRDVSARLAVEKMKNEFVSVVSHELRTPLTSIRGSLGLLAGGMGGHLSPPGVRMVTIALDSSERLTRLIEDMLDLERMESGSLAMTVAECSAASLFDTALHDVDALAVHYDVRVVPGGLGGIARGDPDRIVQVLTNLIGNAIKFSPRGGRVTVSSRPVDDAVEFAVTDEGRGIPPDKLSAIFDRFEQVDSSDSRERGGTGLGLTICRDIVRLHGGRIWAESVLGHGATFRFTVPSQRHVPAPAEVPAELVTQETVTSIPG